jgi:hypothetical protein
MSVDHWYLNWGAAGHVKKYKALRFGPVPPKLKSLGMHTRNMYVYQDVQMIPEQAKT